MTQIRDRDLEPRITPKDVLAEVAQSSLSTSSNTGKSGEVNEHA